MNKAAVRTLEVLYDFCRDEGYKIIDAEDILTRLENIDADSLFETIDNLNTENFVAVKYSDKTEYCLSLTKTGIIKVEEEIRRAKEEAIKRERERQERLKQEQLEYERQEAEAKRKSPLKAFRKKEEPVKPAIQIPPSVNTEFESTDVYEPLTGDEAVVSGEIVSSEPRNLVLREVMLNRDTMRIIARVAFFSGLIGAALGSLIISLIFVFL